MEKVKVAVVGASGYSGSELLRLLLRHEYIEIACLTSRQFAGQAVGEVFPRFRGTDLFFQHPEDEEIADKARVVFMAVPHGVAAEYVVPLRSAGVTVVDISADFRLSDPETYALYYGRKHPAPELLQTAVYGLPEINRSRLKDAGIIACPGCYPTGAILPLIPLLREKLVDHSAISVVSMSGVTGAGRKASLPLLFGECNESMRPYNVANHRHLPEIEEQLGIAAGGEKVRISFVPHLMPVSRGIVTTILARGNKGTTAEVVHNALVRYYQDEPFVRVLCDGNLPDTKNVTMTNVCELSARFDERTGQVILNSAVDNLTKGAAGQAIQAMNIALGFPESTGLD